MTERQADPPRRGRPPIEIDDAALHRVAITAFAATGYQGARLDDVAAEAGITKPVLFRRFGSKNGLYNWTVDAEVRRLTEYLFTSYEKAEKLPTPKLIREGIRALIDYSQAHPDGFRLLFQTGHEVGSKKTPPVEKARALVSDRIEEIVGRRLSDAGAPSGRGAAVIAAAIVGSGEQVARLCLADPSLDPERVGDLLCDVLVAGMLRIDRDKLAAADRPRGRAR